MAIRLSTFRGEAPRIAARALTNEGSTAAIGARLLSADLDVWRNISSVFLLGKAGPTATIYSYYDGTTVPKWFSWATTELMDGATMVSVARVPAANDTTVRTVYTGTGIPKITNKALALGGMVIPNGPYPIDFAPLAVPAPAVAPGVVNTPGSAINVTTTNYNTDMTGWVVAFNGAYGTVTSVTGTSGAHSPAIAYPCYDFNAQQANSTWANINGGFGTGTATSFTVDLDVGPPTGAFLTEQQDAIMQIVSDGNGFTALGGQLFIGYGAGAGNITWTDQGAGSAPVVVAAPGTVGTVQGVHVKISAVAGPKNSSGIATFVVGVVVTDAATSAPVASASGLIATFCGDILSLAATGGANAPDSGHVFFGRIAVAVTGNAATVPVYSSYLDTQATDLLLESGPSPASTPPVQVDNGNINTITFAPPDPADDIAILFLYRVASGASGAQFLQVVNGTYEDGGFPICTVGGTANAITLADVGADPNAQNASYFFIATATSTGAVTINGKVATDASGTPIGAGGIVSGNHYTAVFEREIVLASAASEGTGASTLSFASTLGIANGQIVTDATGAIAPGTTVASFVANTSITLSAPTTTPISAGNLFYFATLSDQYTILDNYVYRDATPTSALGDPLPSADWDPPPDNLQGIISLPNEIMAGFVANTLLLSVQGQPQAWPLGNQYGTDSPIVVLVALDSNIAILTQGKPVTAYGSDPAAFTMTAETFPQGCVSMRSAAYLRGYGAVYASTDGIYVYGGLGQIRSLTKNLFTLREWLPLNPASIIGIVHQGLYFFWYDTTYAVTGSIAATTLTVTAAPNTMLRVGSIITGSGVTSGTRVTEILSGSGGVGTYTVNHSQTVASEALTVETKRGYVLDPDPEGFGIIELDFHVSAAAINSVDDTLYLVVDDGTIVGDATPANNELCQWEGATTTRAMSWTSKLYQAQYPTAFQLCRIRAAGYTGLNIKLYADGAEFASINPTSDVEFTIPPKMWRQFQFTVSRPSGGVSGQTAVQTLEFVERADELMA